MFIACIGKRELTRSEFTYLESCGTKLAEEVHVITTGNAPGADQAFALGASVVDPASVELYLPWTGFEIKKAIPGQKFWTADDAEPKHLTAAQEAHPAWNQCSQGAQKLLVRNAMLILRFDRKVDQVMAYPNVEKRGWGGTGHAIRVAYNHDIKVHLLNEARDLDATLDRSLWR